MTSKICCLILLLNCTLAFSASFNCSQAKTKVENLICKNVSISSMDELMSSLYTSLVKNYSDSKPIKIWQKNWLTERNSCDDIKCLEDSYRLRISYMELALTANSSTRKWTGYYTRYVNGKKDTHTSDVLLIALNNSKIFVEGSSFWIGNAKTGDVNIGELQGLGDLNGSILQGAPPNALCSAKIILTINSTLVILDESGCGGMNVTFNGEYLRH